MSDNYVQKGEVIDWTNGTGSAVSAGDVIEFTDKIGIAETDIANGATGAVAVEGVFTLSKSTDATAGVFAPGKKVNWDTTNDRATLSATGIQPCGYCIETVVAATTTAKIKINA